MHTPHTQDLEDRLADVTTREGLAQLLKELHVRADSPSLRELDARTAHQAARLTKSTVADMLAGRRFPRKAVLLAFLRECGLDGDRAAPWTQTWERIAATQRNRPAGGSTELQQLREQVIELQAELGEAEQARKREFTEHRKRLEQRVAQAEERAEQAETALTELGERFERRIAEVHRELLETIVRHTADLGATAVEQRAHQPEEMRKPPATYHLVSAHMSMPIYLACDVSASMGGAQIEALNAAIPELLNELHHLHQPADLVRFGLLSFSSDAHVVINLTEIHSLTQVPVFTTAGATRYGPIFRLLRETIDRDVAQLGSEGRRLCRPVVLFVTSGTPADHDWWRYHRKLIDPGWSPHPHILAFGLDAASGAVIGQIATSEQALPAVGTASPITAPKELPRALTRAVIAAVEHELDRESYDDPWL